jgi:hypothetical protein
LVSGSAARLTDPDDFFLNPRIQDITKKIFDGTFQTFHHYSKTKSRQLQKNINQGVSYYFCLMIEGSESVPLSNGFGRPKIVLIYRLQTLVSRNFILYLKLGPASHIDDGEGPVLHISLNCGIVELPSDQTLSVEDGVVRVDGHLKNKLQ